jgi:hypothetical protein
VDENFFEMRGWGAGNPDEVKEIIGIAGNPEEKKCAI